VQSIPGLKFLCIDTFSEHLKPGNEISHYDRRKMISEMLMSLNKVAHKYGVCVVLVNNMKPGKREYIPGGDGPDSYSFGQPTKPEPLIGEELF
jgi:hypothetical protein